MTALAHATITGCSPALPGVAGESGGRRSGGGDMPVTTVFWPASARALLRHRCQGLVATEMTRLARGAPLLGAAHLGEAQAALARVIGKLVLSRGRTG